MGVMNKMRESTGVVLWILVIAFGVIFMLQDTDVFSVIGTPGTAVAEVDGDPIGLEEYQQAVDSEQTNRSNQSGEALTQQQVDALRDQVFERLVNDRILQHEMDRLGIQVTDTELRDQIIGDNPHQIIQVYFNDGAGNVDRALLQNFIDNPDLEGDQIAIENYIRGDRARQKLNNLIAATVRVSDAEVAQEFARRNRKVDAEYVALRFAQVPDSAITVTDSDLRDYYSDNREDFAQEKTYTLAYVTASKNPTPEDTVAVREELERMKTLFAEAEDDSLFLVRNASERPYTDAYFTRGDLDPVLADLVFENPVPGLIVGPAIAGNEAHLVKIVDVRDAEEETIRARHILIRSNESDDAETRAAARQQILDIRQEIREGADFADVARRVSQDPGSGRQGGDLGWFGRERMVESFADAAFEAPLNRVVGPVETQFGFHLIEVTDRADQEVQIVDFATQIRPSSTTLKTSYDAMDEFKYFAEDTDDFEGEAERRGLQVQQVQVQDGTPRIPGIGVSRSLNNFMKTKDEGAISDVVELDDRYLVATLRGVSDEGYRAFEDVRGQIEARVKREKKLAYQRQQLESALAANGFEGLPQALNTTLRTVDDLSATAPVVAGLGREPVFVGTALTLDAGEVSDVLEGQNAVYVLKVTNVEAAPEMTEADATQLRNELVQQRQSQVRSRWLAALREQAEVKDYRYRFNL